MSKDDYDVLVAKVLVFLYAKLKEKNDTPIVEYIHPLSKDFPVSEDYLNYVLDEMIRNGYITMKTIKAWGGEVVYRNFNTMKITSDGIHYLRDNSTMRKIADTIPMAAAIFELFQ